MKIIPISEGSFTIDKTKHFIPFNKENDKLEDRATGSLLVEIQPFVVITKRDVILIDTGLGFYTADGKMQIHQNMIDKGIDPASVTKVLLSHLHKDHAGGIQNESGSALSFPSAKYYLNREELEFASSKKSRSYDPAMFNLLVTSPNLALFEDIGLIDGYIKYELSGGHSPHHVVFTITEGEEIIFFGGDVAPQLKQMKTRLVAKYDFDGKKSRELRDLWWEKGRTEKWIFLFYHDIACPFTTPV